MPEDILLGFGDLVVEVEPPHEGQTLTVVPIAGGKGDKGDDGAAGNRYFEYDQPVPASEWVVNHNFGELPLAQVIIDGEVVGVPIVHQDANTIYIQFATPQIGKVICQ